MGYRSEKKKGNRGEKLRLKKEFGSPGSAMRYLQPSSLPPGAAGTLSLPAALGSNPVVGTEGEEEGPGMTFWLGESGKQRELSTRDKILIVSGNQF